MKPTKNKFLLSVLILILSAVTFPLVGCGTSSTSGESISDECAENPSSPLCNNDDDLLDD